MSISKNSLQDQHPNETPQQIVDQNSIQKPNKRKRSFADYGFNVRLFLNLYG